MIEKLINVVYKMYTDYERDRYTTKECQLVMLCSPAFYYELRKNESNRIRYEKTLKEYDIPILYIIGIKLPIVIRRDLSEEIQFQVMYRENYERLEQEEQFKKFMEMWSD